MRKPRPYPIIKESIRINPKPRRADQVCSCRKGKPKKDRRNPDRPKALEVSMLGTLREIYFKAVSGEMRRYSVPARVLILVCQTASKRLCFVYGPKESGRDPLSFARVHIENYREFNGFDVQQALKGQIPLKHQRSLPVGVMTDIVYHSAKCIDPVSCSSPGDYRHKFKSPYPTLYLNPNKQLVVEGGGYHIERRGIVN